MIQEIEEQEKSEENLNQWLSILDDF